MPQLVGRPLAEETAGDEDSTTCEVRFQGQWEDRESGLFYNRFRYYDPQTSAYLSEDPLGINGDLRIRGYTDNPLRWVDPLGLAKFDPCAKGTSGTLADGYTYRVDSFNSGGASSFELHVYDPSGAEVGIHGPTDFLNKHGIEGGGVNLPPNVQNALKGVVVDQNRGRGLLPDKGMGDISGDKWKNIVKCRLKGGGKK